MEQQHVMVIVILSSISIITTIFTFVALMTPACTARALRNRTFPQNITPCILLASTILAVASILEVTLYSYTTYILYLVGVTLLYCCWTASMLVLYQAVVAQVPIRYIIRSSKKTVRNCLIITTFVLTILSVVMKFVLHTCNDRLTVVKIICAVEGVLAILCVFRNVGKKNIQVLFDQRLQSFLTPARAELLHDEGIRHSGLAAVAIVNTIAFALSIFLPQKFISAWVSVLGTLLSMCFWVQAARAVGTYVQAVHVAARRKLRNNNNQTSIGSQGNASEGGGDDDDESPEEVRNPKDQFPMNNGYRINKWGHKEFWLIKTPKKEDGSNVIFSKEGHSGSSRRFDDDDGIISEDEVSFQRIQFDSVDVPQEFPTSTLGGMLSSANSTGPEALNAAYTSRVLQYVKEELEMEEYYVTLEAEQQQQQMAKDDDGNVVDFV